MVTLGARPRPAEPFWNSLRHGRATVGRRSVPAFLPAEAAVDPGYPLLLRLATGGSGKGRGPPSRRPPRRVCLAPPRPGRRGPPLERWGFVSFRRLVHPHESRKSPFGNAQTLPVSLTRRLAPTWHHDCLDRLVVSLVGFRLLGRPIRVDEDRVIARRRHDIFVRDSPLLSPRWTRGESAHGVGLWGQTPLFSLSP
jgi:hypothetical protein